MHFEPSKGKLTGYRLTQMGLKSKDGVDIKDIWAQEISSYLGMLIHGFPNAFMVYSPQGLFADQRISKELTL
jgi:hypothetical protein